MRESHAAFAEATGPHVTLEDYTLFERWGFCLTCQSLIHDEECLCTGFPEDDEDA